MEVLLQVKVTIGSGYQHSRDYGHMGHQGAPDSQRLEFKIP
jgi:hypothetical protein